MTRGFTLIELLFVIAIVGILSTVGMMWVGRQKEDDTAKEDCKMYLHVEMKHARSVPEKCVRYYRSLEG